MGFSLQCDSSCICMSRSTCSEDVETKPKRIEETMGKVVIALLILKVVAELSLPGYSDFYNLMGFTYKKMSNNTLKNVY
jgi:hypothetical protein